MYVRSRGQAAASSAPTTAAATAVLCALLWCGFAVTPGSAVLQCYVCNSSSTPACADTFAATNIKLVNCSGSCVKTRAHAETTSLGNYASTEYSRGCDPQPNKSRCTDTEATFIIVKTKVTECHCSTNACNGARPATSTLSAAAAAFAATAAAVLAVRVAAVAPRARYY